MRRFLYVTLVALVFAAAPAIGADAINMELSRLVAADQAARRQSPIDWSQVRAADAKRRDAVIEMLRSGQISAPVDFENASLILHHGEKPDDFRLAHALATVALSLEPDRRLAKWLQRAAWDRLLLSLGKAQWYGTQKSTDPKTGAQTVLPLDPQAPEESR